MKKSIHYIVLMLISGILFVSCKNTRQEVIPIHINEKPKDGIFKLTKTKIDVACADFQKALTIDELGYPRVDFNKFDMEISGKVIKTFNAVILENKYIKLTLIPEKGKPYSFIYKVTGHEEFFVPSVAQAFGSPNKLGWWLALGGVEYTMPDNEHGETWAAKWSWEIVEDSPLKKTVRMKVKELGYGLEETIDISIYPDKSFFEAAIFIKNPTVKPVMFQHWINPMWTPGGQGEVTEHTEFIMPTKQVLVTERKFNKWMLDYHSQKNKVQDYEDSPLRFLTGWKNIGDLLASKLEHGFYSAFSHDENEGIVRIFPMDKNPGCNIWAWGINPDPKTRKRFSGSEDCRGCVEMWGGITHGFDEYYQLNQDEAISWTEWMYPYNKTKGLHYANKDFAVTFTRLPGNEHILRLCPSGDLSDVECKIVSVKNNKILLHVIFDYIYPQKKLQQFTQNSSKEDLELVIVQNGREIVRLPAKFPPVFPDINR
ncbi:MAG: DUF5107 domain-containing protein [Bacteroidales bacterium]|nr:DUF5107 domain-containing protein [Bacteroidales bacterium]